MEFDDSLFSSKGFDPTVFVVDDSRGLLVGTVALVVSVALGCWDISFVKQELISYDDGDGDVKE